MSDLRKYEELIESAFNWYYEEGMHHTDIGNNEAMVLFVDTDIFKNWCKANAVCTNDKPALPITNVVGQSEQCCDKCGSEYYHTYKCTNTLCENCIIYD